MRSFLLVTALAACRMGGGGPGGQSTPEDTEPSITLTSPADGSQRYGSSIDADFELANFAIDPQSVGSPNEEGHGHVHAYVDGVMVGEVTGDPYTFLSVPSGGATLEFRLAENDHSERWEGSWAWVDTLAPNLTILDPADGTTLSASSAALTLALSDFTVDSSVAFGDPAFGQGRYNVLVDDAVVDYGFDPAAADVSPLTEGAHTVTLELATADGTPLDPPVRDTVNLTVLAGSPALMVDRTPYMQAYNSASVPLDVSSVNAPLDYHVYQDGTFVTRSQANRVNLNHVPAGHHRIELRLVNGGSETTVHDHINLYVPEGRPDVNITYPGDSWGVAPDFTLTAAAENFTLDPSMTGPNAAGTGHMAVSVDGVQVAKTATGSVALSALPSGPRVIEVSLLNNDDTPLDPPVRTSITVDVR